VTGIGVKSIMMVTIRVETDINTQNYIREPFQFYLKRLFSLF
jgi:hypothetical protein